MGRSVNATLELKIDNCITCGCTFALPQEMYDNYRRIGGFFSCPSGHRQGWAEGSDNTEIKKLKKRIEWAEHNAEEERAAARKARAATAAVEKKLKNLNHRVAHGVCPCCKRTFKQLAAHMARKHPEAVT